MDWHVDLTARRGPIYLALADAIERAIRSGQLLPGDRLPTQKDMARQLDIDVTTVVRAYAQVSQAGLIQSGGRRGSIVTGAQKSASAIDAAPEELAAMDAAGMNMPPEPAGGALSNAIRQGMDQILSSPGPLPVHYQSLGGMDRARRGAAERLSAFLPATNPEQIIITAGSQNALHAICNALLAPGDRVAVGAFTYPGFLAVARQLHASLVPLDMDEDGIMPEALEVAAKAGLKALFVVPTNDNPTTATLPELRRRRIAELAETYDFAVIEDDPYGPLAEEMIAPVTAFAPSRGWYISTLSKMISPFMRVAIVRAPSIRESLDLASDVQATAIMAPPLNNALAGLWWRDGTMEELVAAVRTEAVARQTLAKRILGAGQFRAQPEGYHLWIPLPDGPGGANTIASAGFSGLPVVPASTFAVEPSGREQSLRVSLGGARTRERVERDLGRLDALLARRERTGTV